MASKSFSFCSSAFECGQRPFFQGCFHQILPVGLRLSSAHSKACYIENWRRRSFILFRLLHTLHMKYFSFQNQRLLVELRPSSGHAEDGDVKKPWISCFMPPVRIFLTFCWKLGKCLLFFFSKLFFSKTTGWIASIQCSFKRPQYKEPDEKQACLLPLVSVSTHEMCLEFRKFLLASILKLVFLEKYCLDYDHQCLVWVLISKVALEQLFCFLCCIFLWFCCIEKFTRIS